jgi:nucleotide-binding universal stress UspA family protein
MYRTILVGTDGSPTASLAVARAADLAIATGAALVICSAYKPVAPDRLDAERRDAPPDVAYGVSPSEEAETILAAAKELAEGRGAEDARTIAVSIPPEEALLDVARRISADAIVVGSQGMAGARRLLLGSVPNRVAHHAGCDVLIVKTDGAKQK